MSKRIGSKFTDFLEEEGIKDDVDLLTVKKVLADEIEARMEKLSIGISELARRMGSTGRDSAYRLLDKEDTGVTLKTLSKAARALNWSLIDLLQSVERHHRRRGVRTSAATRSKDATAR